MIAAEDAAEGEVEPLLKTEEAEGGAGTVAKLRDGSRFQGEAVDGGPCMVEQLQTVLTVGGRQFAAVDVVKHVNADEVEPAVVLVEGEQVLPHPQTEHLAAHALVGTEIVEAADRHLMGDRGGVLAVIVDTRTTAYLTGGKIVQAGGVVVAIGAAGLVVGITAVDVCPYAVESVNLPRQAETESLVSVQTPRKFGNVPQFLRV